MELYAELQKRVLKQMLREPTGPKGNEHYYAPQFAFYDFQEETGLDTSEYEKFMLDMGKNGWIKIEFRDGKRYERAIISATSKAGIILEG